MLSFNANNLFYCILNRTVRLFISMTERFGARLKYEDELAAEMRQCEEQLELMYLKRRQRKQQKERDEKQRLKVEEERRARKAAKIEEERRVKSHETELKKIEEAIQRRQTEYLENKRLGTIKLERMKEEMDKVGAELQKVMARRDSARKARKIRSQEALAKREDDEKKENMQRQSDVKVETLNLKDQHIGFHKTSDELHKFQTPIPIPHGDDVEVPGICIAKSHSGIPSLETCSIPSASIPPHVATVKIVQSSIVLVEGIQTACRPEPCCDVTSTESAPSQVNVVPVLVVPSNLALNDSLDLTVTDEVDLDDHQDRTLKPVLSEVQEDSHSSLPERRYDVREAFVECNTEVHGAKLKLADMTLCKADVPQSKTVEFLQAAHLAIPYLPKSHANHTVQIVRFLYYCYASTLVSKIFYCVSCMSCIVVLCYVIVPI